VLKGQLKVRQEVKVLKVLKVQSVLTDYPQVL